MVELDVAMVRVEEPELVTAVLLNVPDAPEGRPETLRATDPVKPSTAPIEAVKVVLDPCWTVRDVGLAESVKPATVKVTIAEWLRFPLVPVTVSRYVPLGVEAGQVTVMTEVPVPLTDCGLNVAFAPAGRPVTLRFAGPVKPYLAVIVWL